MIVIKLDSEQLSIKDRGIAISKEHLESIFQPFYCVDMSCSKK